MATTVIWLQHITWQGTDYLPGQVATVDDYDAQRLVRGHYARVGTEPLPPVTTPNPLPQYVLDTELQAAVDAAVQQAQGDFVTEQELADAVTARLQADGYITQIQLDQAVTSAPYASDADVQAAVDAAVAAAPYVRDDELDDALPAALPGYLQPAGLEAELADKVGEVSAHPLARFYAALARRHRDPARIVTLGSSTTAGLAATHREQEYTSVLLRQLQAAWPSGIPGLEAPPLTLTEGVGGAATTMPGVQLYNGGVGGTTAGSYVTATALGQIAALAPALVIHMIGSNDSVLEVPVATYKQQVADVVDSIATQQSANGKPVSQVLVHTYRRASTITLAVWAEYGEALRQIADTRPDVLFVDVSAPYEQLALYSGNPWGVNADGVHMTDTGHAVMADLLAKAMRVDRPPAEDARLVLVDTFSRAPGALGSPDMPAGRAWETYPAGNAVISARGVVTHAAGGTMLVDAGVADQDVTGLLNIGAGQSGSLVGMVVRGSDDTNRWGVFFSHNTQQLMVYRARTGVGTSAVYIKALALQPNTTYVLRVIAKGDKIVAYVNGVWVLEYTMSADDYAWSQAFTKVGYRCAAATVGQSYRTIAVRRL